MKLTLFRLPLSLYVEEEKGEHEIMLFVVRNERASSSIVAQAYSNQHFIFYFKERSICTYCKQPFESDTDTIRRCIEAHGEQKVPGIAYANRLYPD